jgi:hypothetical protein
VEAERGFGSYELDVRAGVGWYDRDIRRKERPVGDYDQRLFTNPQHPDKYGQVQRGADKVRAEKESGYRAPLQRLWDRITKRGETAGS